MNLEKISQSVQSRMPEKRWIHTLGVISSAEILAHRFGASPDKAKLAAVLHDVCKYWSIDQQAHLLREHRLGEDLLDYNKELWHAPLGAYIAEVDYQISDQEVLDAIRYHTSGRESMTILDKIVCLADYIELNRNYPGVEKIRELANHHLEKALIAGFDSTIAHLIAQHQRIYPLTILARNDLILHL